MKVVYIARIYFISFIISFANANSIKAAPKFVFPSLAAMKLRRTSNDESPFAFTFMLIFILLFSPLIMYNVWLYKNFSMMEADKRVQRSTEGHA